MSQPERSARRPAFDVVWLAFIALSIIWGSSFLFIKIGLDAGLPPFSLVSYRLLFAALFLVVALRLTGGRLPRTRDAWLRLGVLAILNVAIPFTFLTWGEQYITSALTSILNGLTPLFTIVIAALILRDEPITLNRLAGLLVGFAGAVLLASPNLGAASGVGDSSAIIGELAVSVAALSYAAAAVYARHVITGRPLIEDPLTGPRTPKPAEIALPQVSLALVATTALAVLVERPPGGLIALPASSDALFAVLWLGILGSGVAYLLYFTIIRAWGATRATLVTYVMPIVGICLGVAVLGERLHPAEILGALLVFGGLVLANSSFGQRRLFGRAPAAAPARPASPRPD